MSDDQLTASEYKAEGDRDRCFHGDLTDRRLIGAGVLICGPLYLAMVFVAALVEHAWIACNLAILDTGVCFLAYAVQLTLSASSDPGSKAEYYLVPASIVIGSVALIALIFGV